MAAVAGTATVAVVVEVVTNAMTKAPRQFSQTATNWSFMWRPIVSHSQQTRTRFQPGISPPNQIDRDRVHLIVLILMIG